MSKRERIYMYAGTVIAFGLCSLFHFAYDFFGRPFWLAGFFPISESIWEHLKLPFYSLMLLNVIPWCEFVKRCSWKERLFFAAFQSEMTMFVVVFGYYGIKGGLGKEGLGIDLSLLFLGLLWSLVISVFFRKYLVFIPSWIKNYFFIKAMIMFVLFWIFSFYIPQYPIFQI